MSKLSQKLRHHYPEFIYHDFHYYLNQNRDFIVNFRFSFGNKLSFTHQLTLTDVNPKHLSSQKKDLIDNLVFHLGLIESFSYWKLAASPLIKVDCGQLCDKQLAFWHSLLLDGMGEYFYVNDLDFTVSDFVHIQPSSRLSSTSLSAIKHHTGRHLAVNLGGGKDSAVMLSLLTHSPETFSHLIVQPASPATTALALSNKRPTHLIHRQFDPQLRQLNRQSFLNGHVPFSASLAFINLLAGVLYDFDYALVGNESSSDECSLHWHDRPINHQFSKSTKFEQDFITYSRQFIINNVHYFSFLRVFNELQIAQIFCSNPEYFSLIKSCNRHQQQGDWCHHCPKCLFVFLLFSAFLPPHIVSSHIFSHNLFADHSLLPTLQQLLGLAPTKPLECVGTIHDSQAAFYLALLQYQKAETSLPPLLSHLRSAVLSQRNNWSTFTTQLLTQFYPHHSLPDWTLSLIKKQFSFS